MLNQQNKASGSCLHDPTNNKAIVFIQIQYYVYKSDKPKGDINIGGVAVKFSCYRNI